ncbi:MAG TPA: GldG family protein [Candidatus Udaeobacter sp.]|nr:GldG family protein [Candidatus Udaeobacter sp.]
MKIGRIRIGLNVVVQIVLILFLAAMVNSLAFKHYKRWDFSRDQKYALSDKTKRFLNTLKGKMRITVFFSPNTPITADVQNLLTEYQYAGKGKVDLEQIDPERNLSRAKELFDKYKVVTDESLLVLDYDGHNKTVKASEMADVDQSGMALGEGPRVAAFKGEQAITSAMIDLVEGKKKTLGYVTGHKEPALSAPTSPISLLKTFIENENIKFQELNLLDQQAIPADVSAAMIVGPQYDFSEREMQVLRNFWDKQGRILVFVDPAANTPRLRAFLDELGVKVNDDRLMVFVRTGIQELALTRDVQARFLADSPVTKRLADVRTIFVGGTASLTLDPNRSRAANIRLEPLIQAEKGYFAETDYNSDNQPKLQADAQKAGDMPLTIAASAEKGGSADARVQVNSSRLVAVSNATFVQDTAIMQDQAALDFVSGAVNWVLRREQMIGIAPKIPKPLTFNLDPEALRRLRWVILVLMPLIPAAIGTVVWWQRRV